MSNDNTFDIEDEVKKIVLNEALAFEMIGARLFG